MLDSYTALDFVAVETEDDQTPDPELPSTSYVGTRPVIAQYIGSQLVTATH